MKDLFIPHEKNNNKAKLVHPSGLFIIKVILIIFQLLLSLIPGVRPKILGYAANISPDEIVLITNEKRVAQGLAPLELNPTLSQAAQAKAVDMLNQNYWAHVAPDGTQPWQFFIDFGYRYRYAGENLARDFSNANSAVEAWMASPSHRDNILSASYREIGIGIVEGDLGGVETTLIVQFFGTKYADPIPTTPVAGTEDKPIALATPVPTLVPTPQSTPTTETLLEKVPETVVTAPTLPTPTPSAQILISPFTTTKGVSLIVVVLLLATLVFDGLVTSKRRIARIGGKTFAHIAFLGMILAVVLILKAGQIL